MEMYFLIKAQINWLFFRITYNRYEYLGLEIIKRSMYFRNGVGYLWRWVTAHLDTCQQLAH